MNHLLRCSAADGLFSPFDSINFAEQLLGNDMACSPINSDAIGSIFEASLQGYSTHYSSVIRPQKLQGCQYRLWISLGKKASDGGDKSDF